MNWNWARGAWRLLLGVILPLRRAELTLCAMGCPRDQVLQTLELLAPLRLAEPWDNVGLLVDPDGRDEFEKAFVTIDLTETTLSEALGWQADLIVAYHPPLFSGLKRLRFDAPTERIAVRCLCAGLTVYSPHTALDAVPRGMTDWLAETLGSGETTPIVPHEPGSSAGAGRVVRLDAPIPVEQAIVMIKAHLGLPHVRLSRAPGDSLIRSLAVCPGAGGSVLERVEHVDLLLTGEMRHHDVLARRSRGTHVVLTDHTNTERAYLPRFAEALARDCSGLSVLVSSSDADPLAVV